MKNVFLPLFLFVILISSCVSKKKYAALEFEYKVTKSN